MTIKEATEIVIKAAKANANGHSDALRILEAAKIVKRYVAEQEEP